MAMVRKRWPVRVALALALLAAALSFTAGLRHSFVFDEAADLAAGLSYWRTGDFRLSPDHPPLPRLWATAPAALLTPFWPAADDPAWLRANAFEFGRTLLCYTHTPLDSHRLVLAGRAMQVLLLAATVLVVYGIGRDLLGSAAGLLSATLATACPSLLAHGGLVTTDLPITFVLLLVVWTAARLLAHPSWPRLAAAAAALSAAAITKFSWPLVLPVLLIMALFAWWRSRRQRALSPALLLVLAGALALSVYVSIWAAYGFRPYVLNPPPRTLTADEERQYALAASALAIQWNRALYDPDTGTPLPGFVRAFLRSASEQRWLPDAYVLGLAKTLFYTEARLSYLCGAYRTTGWWYYFPLAFALKTPVTTLLLIAAGLAALALRRMPARDPVLLLGLLVFVGLFATAACATPVNIGHRHILPLYPPLLVLAGGSIAWVALRWGRACMTILLLGLVTTNVLAFPHYLAYFNEPSGGLRNGHRWLLDSNLDWGQDLWRLRDYAARHPGVPLRVAYFGSADPTRFLACELLPSYMHIDPVTPPAPGLYIVSATQLFGVYDETLRDDFWTPRARDAFHQIALIAGSIPQPDESPTATTHRARAREELPLWQARRLVSQLKHRTSDDRIGASLFVYRLSAADVDRYIQP